MVGSPFSSGMNSQGTQSADGEKLPGLSQEKQSLRYKNIYANSLC